MVKPNNRAIEELAGKRVLITGASGFIGSYLAERLCKIGAEVHATSRSHRVSNHENFKWWTGTLENYETGKKILAEVRPNVIYHLAGEVTAANDLRYMLPTHHSLLTSTVNILTLAAEMDCERIILTGSSTEPLDDNPEPNSPYSAAKWATRVYGQLFQRLYQLPVIVLRPFMGYGPAQSTDKLIPFVILSLLKGESPKLSNGRWITDWIYIEDTVEGILLSSVLPSLEGRPIDLGSGELTSVRQVVEEIFKIMKPDGSPVFGEIPDRYIEHTRMADTEFAYSKLRWKAKVKLEEGLRTTVQWFKNHGKNKWYSLSLLDLEILEEHLLAPVLLLV